MECPAVPGVLFYSLEPVCHLSLREPGQSWEPALTGSSFQLIWLANLISTWSPVAQSQFPLDFPSHGSLGVQIQHLMEITGEARSVERLWSTMGLKSTRKMKPPWSSSTWKTRPPWRSCLPVGTGATNEQQFCFALTSDRSIAGVFQQKKTRKSKSKSKRRCAGNRLQPQQRDVPSPSTTNCS